MSSMIPLVEKEISLKFFLEPFVSLCGDHTFGIRTVCAMRIGTLCKIAGTVTTESILLPAFVNLCNDELWGVRKACADVFIDVANVVTHKTRVEILPDLFINLLNDHSRYVKNAAYQSLGGFIYSFHDICRQVSVPSDQGSSQNESTISSTPEQDPLHDADELSLPANRTEDTDPSVDSNLPSQSKGECLETKAAPLVDKLPPETNCQDETVYNDFQFWRDPLPEIEVDIDGGKATNTASADNWGNCKASRFQVHTVSSAYINTFTEERNRPWTLDRQSTSKITRKRVNNFRQSILVFKDDSVEEYGNKTGASEMLFNAVPDNTKEVELSEQQDVVPPKLLSKYLEASNPKSWHVMDDELIAHCAYSFPAVAFTLGSRHWPCIRQTYQKFARDIKWTVRRMVASSLHEMAVILGSDITAADLRPIFLELLKDVDEVRLGLVLHLSDFLKHLSSEDRWEFLAGMEDFSKTDQERNWRYRCTIAEQLIPTLDLYHPFDINEYFLPIAISLLQDKVFAVRLAATELMAVITKHLYEDNKGNLLADLDASYRQAQKWSWRQTYVFFCEQLARKNSLSVEEFVDEIVPRLFSLAWDAVPNVRLAVSRCLALTLLPLDYLPVIQKSRYELLLQVMYSLQGDVDEDVKFYARLSAKEFNVVPEKKLSSV